MNNIFLISFTILITFEACNSSKIEKKDLLEKIVKKFKSQAKPKLKQNQFKIENKVYTLRKGEVKWKKEISILKEQYKKNKNIDLLDYQFKRNILDIKQFKELKEKIYKEYENINIRIKKGVKLPIVSKKCFYNSIESNIDFDKNIKAIYNNTPYKYKKNDLFIVDLNWILCGEKHSSICVISKEKGLIYNYILSLIVSNIEIVDKIIYVD